MACLWFSLSFSLFFLFSNSLLTQVVLFSGQYRIFLTVLYIKGWTILDPLGVDLAWCLQRNLVQPHPINKKHFLLGFATELRPPCLFYLMWTFKLLFNLWSTLKRKKDHIERKQWWSTDMEDFQPKKCVLTRLHQKKFHWPNSGRDRLIFPNYGCLWGLVSSKTIFL